MDSLSACATGVAMLVLSVSSGAQSEASGFDPTGFDPTASTFSVTHSCGVQLLDGRPWGVGPDYKACFDDDSVEYTPALGSAAPHNLPVRFRLIGYGRRDEAPLAVPAGVDRTTDGLSVHYVRPGVVERYVVRPDGIEQSFVFADRPAGSGDLIVRCRIETQLEPTVTGRTVESLSFLREGVGGVSIGAVTGIGADGRRAAGSMRFENGVLELALPDAFVDRAAWPVVLDPLIGTTIIVSGGVFDEEDPDVAYQNLTTYHVYLAVWSRRFSLSNVDIRGRLIDPNTGALRGSVIVIRQNTARVSDLPSVVSVAIRQRFLVAWRESGSGASATYLGACSVSAIDGTVGPLSTFSGGSDSLGEPDLGEFQSTEESALVWTNTTQGRIEAQRLVTDSAGGVNLRGARVILSATGSRARPRISRSNNVVPVFMVVWHGIDFVDSWIEGAIVNAQLSIIDRPALCPQAGPLESLPDVDGYWPHWIVSYDRRVNRIAPSDIYCKWVTWSSSITSYVGPEVLVAGGRESETLSSVALSSEPGSALITYASQTGTSTYTAHLRSVDWFSCVECEGTFTLDGDPARDARNTAVVWRSLAVWESRDPATNRGEIKARRFRSDVPLGSTTDIVCQPRGTTYATCALPGHAGFVLRLEHAEANRPALLLIGMTGTFGRFGCGSCRILDPFRGFVVFLGNTDSHGNVAVPLPIPSVSTLPSISFQFGIQPSSSPACPALNLDFTDVRNIDFGS